MCNTQNNSLVWLL